MPYTNTWDPTTPDGSEDADQIDDIIQALKLDIQERMEDTLFDDFTADPLVLKTTITGEVTGLERWIPFSAFKGATGNDPGFAISTPIFFQDNSSVYAFDIDIPRGAVITELRVVAKIPVTLGCVARIYTIDDDSSDASWTQQTTMDLAPNANGLFNKYTSPAYSITVSGFCIGYVDIGAADQVLGAVVKYNRSSHLLG